MMRLSLLAAITTVTFTAGAGAASAQCILQIEPGNENWRVEYDPFDDLSATQAFDVAFVNVGESVCRGSVQVDLRGEPYGLALPGGSERAPYILVEDNSGVDVTPRAGQSQRRLNARPLEIAPGQRELRRYTLAAEPSALPPAGTYSQTVFLAVNGADGLPVAEHPVNLALDVAASAVMGLTGEFSRGRQGAVIQLKNLASGPQNLPVELYVRSTRGYTVSVTSKNQGRLRLDRSDWYIDYELELGGDDINLASGDQVSVVSSRARQDSYPLRINIGDVSGRRAGDYADTITFTVAAI